MAKQFIVRLKKKSDGTIVANSQVITVNGIGDGAILASDFTDNLLTGDVTTTSRAGSFIKVIAAPTVTTYTPIIIPTTATVGQAIQVAMTGGPPNQVITFRKKGSAANMFGSGYVADTWITGTSFTLNSSGAYTDSSYAFPVNGTATYEFTFPTGATWAIGGPNPKTHTITVSAASSLTFTITPNVSAVNEGGFIGWTLANNAPFTYGTSGRWVKAYIYGTNINGNDVTEADGDPDALSEAILFTASGTPWPGVFTTTTAITADVTTEGVETIYANVTTWLDGSTESYVAAGTSTGVTINDTSNVGGVTTYNPTITWRNESTTALFPTANKTFNLDEFVSMNVNRIPFNTLKVGPAAYKIKANAIMNAFFTGRSTYNATLPNFSGPQTRYGLYRDPDDEGLAYWTNEAFRTANAATESSMVTKFFNAAGNLIPDVPTTLTWVNRHHSYQNTYLSYADVPGYTREITTTVPVNTPLRIVVTGGPPNVNFVANTLFPSGNWSNTTGTLNSSGSGQGAGTTTLAANTRQGGMYTTITFDTPAASMDYYATGRVLEANVAGIGSYNPVITLNSLATSTKTFDVDEFVDGSFNTLVYNPGKLSRTDYKAIVEDVVPYYTGNQAYTITNSYDRPFIANGQVYYGQYRDIDAPQLRELVKEGVFVKSAGFPLPFRGNAIVDSWWFSRLMDGNPSADIEDLFNDRHRKQQLDYISYSWLGKSYAEIDTDLNTSTTYTLNMTGAPPSTPFNWFLYGQGGIRTTGSGITNSSGTISGTAPTFNFSSNAYNSECFLGVVFPILGNNVFISDWPGRALEFTVVTGDTGHTGGVVKTLPLEFNVTANVDLVNEGDAIEWYVSPKPGQTFTYGTHGRWVKGRFQGFGIDGDDIVEAVGDPDALSDSILCIDGTPTQWPSDGIGKFQTIVQVNNEPGEQEELQCVLTTWLENAGNNAVESFIPAGFTRLYIVDRTLMKPKFFTNAVATPFDNQYTHPLNTSWTLSIGGAPSSAQNGGQPVTGYLRKQANVNDFYGAGYVANTWIKTTGEPIIEGDLSSYTAITFDSTGTWVGGSVGTFTVPGTAKFQVVFPTPWPYLQSPRIQVGETGYYEYNRGDRTYTLTVTIPPSGTPIPTPTPTPTPNPAPTNLGTLYAGSQDNTAGLGFQSDGSLWFRGFSGGSPANWHTSVSTGIGSSYEIQFTVTYLNTNYGVLDTANNPPAVAPGGFLMVGGDTVSPWLSLASPGRAVSGGDAYIDFQIRTASDSVVRYTGTIWLDATEDTGGDVSDARLKTNIEQVGTHDLGFGIYEYDIEDRRERGVMAQEVLPICPEAVTMGADGYYRVFYDKINLKRIVIK